ncbi:MAG: NAD(P)H-binding protein [Rhodoblastus sp.]|nr:NAD(P)H-binding protein [Rhodoblastus sp.]
MTAPTKTVLVLGATGALGAAATKAFLERGWRIKALAREPSSAERLHAGKSIDWIAGDAMKPGDVLAAAHGVDVIFHGANPRGYRNWRGLALPMLDNSIAAAKAVGARLVFPGNVYNFGPDAWPVLTEQSPQHPRTRKGRVRVDMEQRLRAASEDGLRVLILRAGDFFGAGYTDSWLGKVILKGGRAAKAIVWPGRRDAGHAWAYLPNLAETFARLLEREATLPAFAVFHFSGLWTASGDEFISGIRRATGRVDLPVRSFPWPFVYLAAPFVTLMREILEMRYLWNEPIRLDNSKLVAELGAEPHTPLDEALAASI